MTRVNLFESRAIIKVVGVGGGGCNAVNRMVKSGLQGVQFIAMNTDHQALEVNLAETRLTLGMSARGLGAGGDPDKGFAAAKESEKEIEHLLEGADMVFITTGLGGGTGTGAAPFIAEIARRMGILTVAVATLPFRFEGPRRRRSAQIGLDRIKEHADTVVVIPNDNLVSNSERRATMTEVFRDADAVLQCGVQGISDIILRTGLINVDFADVAAVLRDAGAAMMGIGRATGANRAQFAAEAAARSPLQDGPVTGAKRMLVNITAGPDFTLGEANDIMEHLAQFTHPDSADIFLGHVLDEEAEGITVTLIAAGLSQVTIAPDREVFRAPEPPTPDATAEERIAVEVATAAPAPRRRSSLAPDELDIPSYLRSRRRSED
jgi:cell division protein FtsZ